LINDYIHLAAGDGDPDILSSYPEWKQEDFKDFLDLLKKNLDSEYFE